jgi:arylsulfatase A-like enzyme
MERLLPALGPAEILPLDTGSAAHWGTADPREQVGTLPALVLRPGQSVSRTVPARAGSRLNFSFAVLRNAPDKGHAVLRVLVDGREQSSLSIAVDDTNRWARGSVVLERDGPTRITFRADHVTKKGTTPAEAWMALGAPRIEVRRPRPRVLVWISQDTVRADHVGAFGYTRGTTPGFDAVSRDWVTFEKGVSTASWTLPSLTSQFTSRYPSFHGAVLESRSRDERWPTLFDVLHSQGFLVVGVTGNPFISKDFSLATGFDGLYFSRGRAKDLNLLAIEALKDWGGGDLALLVHYQDPHSPYEPPFPFDRLFGGTSKVAGEREVKEALYDGEIAYADREIADLLASLGRRGLLDDAVIVYSADHGEEFLDHGGWLHSRTLYEEMLHVPFAVRIPGMKPGRVGEVVSLVDLAPTILDVFGIPAPKAFQGKSLVPLLKGDSFRDGPAFSETERNHEGRHLVSVRDGGMKFILTLAPDHSEVRSELYDLGADPREISPIRDAVKAERYRGLVAAFLSQAAQAEGSSKASHLSPEVEERLKALGYLN